MSLRSLNLTREDWQARRERERLRRIWAGMKTRCYNKSSTHYKWYGGQGVEVCDLWNNEGGFNNFYKWSLENGYRSNLSIDRIDPYGNYSPDNCRWADSITQRRNKKDTRYYELDGVKKPLGEWCETYDMSYGLVHGRLQRGWSLQEALTTPVRQRDRYLAVALRNGISESAYKTRVYHYGWSKERASTVPVRKRRTKASKRKTEKMTEKLTDIWSMLGDDEKERALTIVGLVAKAWGYTEKEE